MLSDTPHARMIRVDHGKPYDLKVDIDNDLTTSQHSAAALLPVVMFQELASWPLLWFLNIAVFQAVFAPDSPTSGVFTVLALLTHLLLVLYSECSYHYKLRQLDRHLNDQPVQLWNQEESQFQVVTWADLRVGHVVLLKKEPVPADIFLLATGHKKQHCFVQTSGLTGHFNLVRKNCIPEISKYLEASRPEQAAENLKHFQGSTVMVRADYRTIDEFTGFVKLVQAPKAYPVKGEHTLLRGTQLKSAVWALGLVLYTGKDTRLAQHVLPRRKKVARLTTKVRGLLVWLVVCGLILTGLSLAFSLQYPETEITSTLIVYLVYYYHLAPVQMLLTLQAIRMLQYRFIRWDKHLSQLNNNAAADRAELTDQLGLVEHVFTDKTGTLTANAMRFRKCFVNDTVYGALQTTEQCQLETHPRFTFYDPSLVFDLHVRRCRDLRLFFKCLCICHNAIGFQGATGQVKYKARSPDEEALLTAAHCFGYSFLGAANSAYFLKLEDKERSFKVLGIHEFTPERQRMSVIVERPSSALLYCKGADTVMMPRCKLPHQIGIQEKIDQFSREGLRVMIMARRYLNQEETREYVHKYTTAKHSLYSQQKLLEELAEEYEKDMQFLGVSGIEDTVQPEVPEAVKQLLHAGVKVWMVTGDKLDNAVKTAYSAALFQASCKLLKLSTDIDLRERLQHYLVKYVFQNPDESRDVDYRQSVKLFEENSPDLCLVITGDVVDTVLNDLDLLKMFVLLSSCTQGLVCCRAQPAQKRGLVALVKKYLSYKSVTLAIGDGPNDVLMLQEADIGVSVVGHAGVQQHSEFAVMRFEDLPRLVLFHGRNNYRRSQKALRYLLHQNCVFVLVVFAYGFYCRQSGSDLYPPVLLSLFAVWVATVPTLALGSTEPPTQTLREGVPGKAFTWSSVGKLGAVASSEAALAFLGVHCLPWVWSETGHALDGAVLRSTVGLYLVLSSSAILFFYSESWTVLFVCLVFLQLILGLLIYSLIAPAAGLIALQSLPECPSILLTVLLMTAVSVLLRLLYHFWRVWRPQNSVLPGFYQVEQPKRNPRLEQNAISSVFDAQEFSQSRHFSDHVAVFRKAWTSLKFYWPSIEGQFKASLLDKYRLDSQAVVWTCAISLGTFSVVSILTTQAAWPLSLRVAEVCAIAALCVLIRNKGTGHELGGLSLLAVAAVCGQVAESIEPTSYWMNTLPILHSVFAMLSIRFAYRVVVGTLLVLGAGVSVSSSESEAAVLVGHCSLSLGVWLVLCAGLARLIEVELREEFVLARQIPLQSKQFQDILGNLMPEFVKDRVKKGIRYIAEEKSMVTVLFCDIYNFEAICGSHTPEELIELLDTFFSLLDRLCDKHGVAKIETVNKTYMVCGGLDDVEVKLPANITDLPAAERCMNMAINIISELESVYLKNGEQFSVKIGIHSGPVIAGVVGSHKPQFSLVGDTVNTASRMCSTIKIPGQIQLSMATYQLIDPLKYSLLPSKVEAKGKGLLHTFYVQLTCAVSGNRHDSLANFSIYLQGHSQTETELLHSRRRNYTLVSQRSVEESREAIDVPLLEFACSEAPDQIAFRLEQSQKHRRFFRTVQRSVAIVYGLLTLYTACFETSNRATVFLQGLCTAALATYTLCFEKLQSSVFFSWSSVLMYTVATIPLFLTLATAEPSFAFCAEVDLLMLAVVLFHFTGLTFSFALVFTVFNIIIWVLTISRSKRSVSYALQIGVSLLACFAMNLLTSYFREQQARTMAELQRKAESEMQTTDSLLKEMLPLHVLQSMKEGVLRPDTHSDVTVLYADISGFTSWASDQPPIKVISMLSKLFCKFDQLCVKHQVYKVHTIGDCYVVLGMTDNRNRDALTECLNVIGMALDMLKIISCLNRKHGTDFQMRIGIHTGTIIAGITGTNIVRYDIYGPDNDIANKAESAGAPGKVNVTADTMDFLTNHGVTHFVYQTNRPVVFELTKRIVPTHFLFPS